MHFLTTLSVAFVAVAAAPMDELHFDGKTIAERSTARNPFKFPLPNGFPNVTSPAAIKALEDQAGGPLPSTPSGGGNVTLSDTAAVVLQGLAFNEIFEVAFFTELLHNITHGVQGYELGDNRALILAALNSSQAQEQLHAMTANGGLKTAGRNEVEPCEYYFPVSSFAEAMRFADNFSGLLVGVISAAMEGFGVGPAKTYPTISQYCAILGQEGQQDGFFRFNQDKVPNANGWLTPTTLSFVYNHINQHYIAKGTCPQTLNIPVYEQLLPLEAPSPRNTTISYSTTQKGVTTSDYIAYMSGPVTPIVVSISDITVQYDGTTQFRAFFPYEAEPGFSRGLTVAALVKNGGGFANVSEVADATLAGPALLQVD